MESPTSGDRARRAGVTPRIEWARKGLPVAKVGRSFPRSGDALDRSGVVAPSPTTPMHPRQARAFVRSAPPRSVPSWTCPTTNPEASMTPPLSAFSYWDELRRHEQLSLAAASEVLREASRGLFW